MIAKSANQDAAAKISFTAAKKAPKPTAPIMKKCTPAVVRSLNNLAALVGVLASLLIWHASRGRQHADVRRSALSSAI